jgi:hypothetical protein
VIRFPGDEGNFLNILPELRDYIANGGCQVESTEPIIEKHEIGSEVQFFELYERLLDKGVRSGRLTPIKEKGRKFGEDPYLRFQVEYTTPELKKWLLAYIDQCLERFEANKIYSPGFPIVQSSGTGKTRLVSEVAGEVLTIYVNCKLAQHRSPSSVVDVFKRIANDWEKLKEAKVKQVGSEKILPLDREKLKIDTPLQAMDELSKPSKERSWERLKAEDEIYKILNEAINFVLGKKDEGMSPKEIFNLFFFDDRQNETWNSILSKVEMNSKRGEEDDISSNSLNKPLIIIAFDEATGLLTNEGEFNLFRIIRACFTDKKVHRLIKAKICFLWLDTSSSVANFAPQREKDSSLREVVSTDLMSPFILRYEDTLEKDFDKRMVKNNGYEILEKRKLSEEGKHPNDAEYLSFLRLGRPLWGTQCDLSPTVTADDLEKAIKEALGLARAKLCFKSAGINYDFIDAISVVSCRVPLRFQNYAILAERMIAQNMATLVDVDEVRHRLYAKYVHEPLLAYAASDIMKSSRNNITEHLLDLVRYDVSKKGWRGEMVFCFGLMDTIDKLTNHNPTLSIEIGSLLDELFGGDKEWENVLGNKKEANKVRKGRVTLCQMMNLEGEVDIDNLRICGLRGMGLIPPEKNTGVDLYIPGFLPNGSLFVLMFQIKNYQSMKIPKKFDEVMRSEDFKRRTLLNSKDIIAKFKIAEKALFGKEKTSHCLKIVVNMRQGVEESLSSLKFLDDVIFFNNPILGPFEESRRIYKTLLDFTKRRVGYTNFFSIENYYTNFYPGFNGRILSNSPLYMDTNKLENFDRLLTKQSISENEKKKEEYDEQRNRGKEKISVEEINIQGRKKRKPYE